ncbi:hypothetical protein SAMN02745945_02204 [Peptoclostridium litorale DSM 5388]|uniref:Uncharacterized protein n=1 Tax=Peptoclostridium litorale DSM 5388 TaxID=1121324 RepID=A0A069RFJ1_PEPLI|nr:hypothetical protein [Peptoclostridium litorale]KDR95781.1 hypothetical protein CLIT_10c05080 [Peptoclostridium litorale DSM 5388]SIO21449.1 hypothetical protein SAMN02745945_02204 [Peptoclostridium litorale DSM 5388]
MQKIMKKAYDSILIAIICGSLYFLANIFEESMNRIAAKCVQIVVLLYFIFKGVYRAIEYKKSNI